MRPEELSIGQLKTRQIIKDLKIQDPTDIQIEDIAWVRGHLLVRNIDLEGTEGRLVRSANYGIISVQNNIREAGKRRFIIAHELGHYELHKSQSQLAMCLDEDFLQWYKHKQPNENEANEFASELLMPEDMFKPKCDLEPPSFALIARLAEEFNTSLTATAIKYMEHSPYRCALVVSRDKKIQWSSRSPEFGYWIDNGVTLHHNTLAIEYFEKNEIRQGMCTVPAIAWIQHENFNSTHVIKEESIVLPRYKTVLSLLWIESDYDFEEDEDDDWGIKELNGNLKFRKK